MSSLLERIRSLLIDGLRFRVVWWLRPFSLCSLSVKKFGAQGNNVKDDTLAIQAAVDFLNSHGGGTLCFPPGDYRVSDPVQLGSNTRVVGAGKGATRIRTLNKGPGESFGTSGNRAIFKGLNIGNLAIEGLSFYGTSIDGANGSGIFLTHAGVRPLPQSVSNVTLRDLYFEGFPDGAIRVTTPVVNKWESIEARECYYPAFRANGGTSLTISNCYANGCSTAGFELDTMTYSTLIGCAADSCGIGYRLKNCRNVELSSCGCEAPVDIEPQPGDGIYHGVGYKLEAGRCISLTSCFAANYLGIKPLPGDPNSFTGHGNTSWLHIDGTLEVTVIGFRGRVSPGQLPKFTVNMENSPDVALINCAFEGTPNSQHGLSGTPGLRLVEVGLPLGATDLVVNSLPLAAPEHRGRVVLVKGQPGVSHDQVYICRQMSTGTFEWVLITP